MSKQRWIAIGRVDDIPQRGSRRVSHLGSTLPIAVFRTAQDEVFALVDRCPHRGGPLSEGIVQGCAVACPLHGWVIHLDDGNAEAPDEGQVSKIAVKVDDGRIMLSAASLKAVAREYEAT